MSRAMNIDLTSCDFCGDSGCADPDCWRCHSPLRPERLRTLAQNLAIAARLYHAWELRGAFPAWAPGCGEPAGPSTLDQGTGAKRRLYVHPDSGSIEDCSARPYSWNSPACVVLRDHEDLWQRYIDAENACDDARDAVLAAAIEEPMTAEEQELHARVTKLHEQIHLDSTEWMRCHDEIEAAAKQLAENGNTALEGTKAKDQP